MRKFVNFLRKEDGLTLVELITALLLFTLVAGIISVITMFGIRSYHKISIENTLRDEADLLMSAIITELYTFAPDMITPTIIPNESGAIIDSSITLERQDGTKSRIRIANGVLTIAAPDVVDPPINARTETVAILAQGSSITLECQNNVPCESGLISIDLSLIQSYAGKDYPLELKSKFGF